MKLLLTTLLMMFSTALAQSPRDCVEFHNLDRSTQLKKLKIILKPAEERGREAQQLAEIQATDIDGRKLDGSMGCTKLNDQTIKCVRPDDGGSFDLTREEKTVTLSTSYWLPGEPGDELEMRSAEDDPWVLEGGFCKVR